MEIDPEKVAGYASPLTDKEHAQLGRIAVLWGQIEHMIDLIIPTFCDLKREEINALGVFDRPMAAKTQFLKMVFKNRAHESVHKLVMEFVTIIENTKVRRNHAFHSMWGWRVEPRRKTVEPCARYFQSPQTNLKPSDLPKLERELNRCARIGKNLFHIAIGEGPDFSPGRFFHGPDGAFRQEWFGQWIKRNPLNYDDLEYGPKGDELPRLKAPHPQR